MHDHLYDCSAWSADPAIEIIGGVGLCETWTAQGNQETEYIKAVHVELYNRYNTYYESGRPRIGR